MTDFRLIPDQQLIALLQDEDKGAYTEIYNRYSRLLYQHAYKKLRNQEEAEDIIHELFAVLWAKRFTLAPSESLSGYLFTAVRNRILDFISGKNIRADYISSLQHFIDNEVAVTDHRVRSNMLKDMIDTEIARLPEKMRIIFELSRKEQLSHRQIAEVLGVSEKTVKNQVNNSLKILRKRLGFFVYLCFLIFFLK